MSADADNLRRSKRNKFHLDVAAMHLAHPERRRTQPGRLTPSPEVLTRRAASLSPGTQGSPASSEPGDEKPRRIRRVPARNANYVYDDSDDDECRRGLEGTNLCVKCPARFETRPGLANHFKLHFGEKRKFACDLCDFSSTTLKSLRFHRRVHDRFGVGPATLTDPHGNGIITVGDVLHCETSLGLGLCTNSSPPQLSPPAAFSAGLLRSNTEPAHLSTLASGSDSPSRVTRRNAVPAPPMTPPPNLVRATNVDVATKRDILGSSRKCTQCPYSAKTVARLKIHMFGHQKRCGFQCPFCSFKSESAGFLKRHVDMHGSASYAWPPAYVGISPRKLASLAVGNKSKCRSSLKILFHQKALQNALKNGLSKWTCPMQKCNFSAALIPQHIIHHIKRHISAKVRRMLRHTCLKCGVCMNTVGALKAHKIARHTKRPNPRALQHFMRERVGANYRRCFEKPKFEIKDESESNSPQAPAQNIFVPSVASETFKIEATDLVLQAIPVCAEKADTKSKSSEFSCPLCPYGTTTRSNLLRHEAKHQVKDLFQCPHCSFSGRTLEFIEKHRRLHQAPNIVPSATTTPSSPMVHGQSLVFVPVSTVIPQSITVPLSNSSSPVIAVSISTSGNGTITVPYNAVAAHLPLSLASVIPAIRERVQQPNPAIGQNEQKLKGLTRRSATEPSLRFIGSDGIKRRRCPLCPYTSKFSCDMRSHMEMHTMNARFKCSQCTYSTKRAVSLRSHLALHAEDNAIRAKVGKAVNVYVQKVLIGTKKGRGLAGFYSCAQCPYVTRICAELWKHARRHLGNSKGFNCSLCSFSSISLEVMEEHQLLHPEGASFIRQSLANEEESPSAPVMPISLELKCDVCPFKTNIYQRMWNHKQKHKKTSKFVCSKCTFSTGSELCLEDHMVVHSEPCSGIDTGAAPSPAPSADVMQKSESEKSLSPDSSQKVEGIVENDKEQDHSQSCTDGASTRSDMKLPLSINVDNALRLMRPTKEVAPVLKREKRELERKQCPDCPFVESDEMIFKMHREMHGGRTRAYACNLCNYSCFAAEALHWHLSLHLPPLSPASAALQRKRGLGRRSFQTSDPIPFGAKHFSCTQCSFRTLNETTFVQHRQQHAQHIQQRLVTQMKRAASEEENKRTYKFKRIAKKSDKMHSCVRCSFRCDTAVAYSRHVEMHTQNALHKCRICDYSANTKQIVDFHEQNHHLDQSLTQLRRNAILAPEVVHLKVTSTDEERAKMAGQEFRCKRCDFHTLEISILAKHFEQCHADNKADRELAADLRMNLVPANSILTTA